MSKVYLMRKGDSAWSPMVTDGAEEVRFDFTFDNLENPTNYVSERAFSLRLPRCAENNKFFGQFCRLDSVVVAGGYTPTEKMRYMVLDSAGLLISMGDAVMSEISRTEYVLSLVGSQARIFRKLMNAGWSKAKAADDSEYTLMTDWLTKTKVGSMLIDGAANRLDAVQVATSWVIDLPLWGWDEMRQANLRSTYIFPYGLSPTETNAFIASIVGFAPTAQGRPKGLDAKQWIYDADGTMLFGKVFGDGVDVEDGAIEAQMGEYRSYLQQPFIYVWRLWQMFALEFSKITGGYTLQLDGGWFGRTDEIYNLVYMLPKIHGDFKMEATSTYTGGSATANLPNGDVFDISGVPTVAGLEDVVLSDTTAVDGLSATDAANITVSGEVSCDFNYRLPLAFGDRNYFSWWNPIVVELTLYSNGVEVDTRSFAIVPLPENGVVNGEEITLDYLYENGLAPLFDSFAAQGVTLATATYIPWSWQIFDPDVVFQPKLAFSAMMHTNGPLEHAEVRTRVHFGTDNCPFFYEYDGHLYNYYKSSGGQQQTITATVGTVTVQSGRNRRSGTEVSLEHLFGDKTPFDVLLQYSKQRHLLWLVDNHAMTVRVVEAKKFFAEASANITDLSGNVDMSELKVSPISWDSHEVVFNTGALKGDGIDGYKDRHDIEYGSLLIKTQNNLNRTRKELLKSPLPASAVMSETYADPLTIIMTPDKLTYIEGFPMPLNVSNGESADNSGNFYYRRSNGRWAGTYRDNAVAITDDAPREVVEDTYAWHAQGVAPEVVMYLRPVLSTMSAGGMSVLFAPVREQYTSMPDIPTAFLYERYWQKYVEEVYNAQNKTLEVDIYLPRAVFDRVRQNPLVVIDHVPYLLTNIDGWGEHNTVCRCTLRQITNINNLKL